MVITDSGLLFWATLYIYIVYLAIKCNTKRQNDKDRQNKKYNMYAYFIYAATSCTEIDDVTSWPCIEYLIPTHRTLVFLLHTFLVKI